MSSQLMSSATSETIIPTVILRPRMQARPPILPGSKVIRQRPVGPSPVGPAYQEGLHAEAPGREEERQRVGGAQPREMGIETRETGMGRVVAAPLRWGQPRVVTLGGEIALNGDVPGGAEPLHDR